MKTVLKYGNFGLGDVVCSVEPDLMKPAGGGGSGAGGLPVACTCHCGRKACCLSQAQATLLVGMLSVVSTQTSLGNNVNICHKNMLSLVSTRTSIGNSVKYVS